MKAEAGASKAAKRNHGEMMDGDVNQTNESESQENLLEQIASLRTTVRRMKRRFSSKLDKLLDLIAVAPSSTMKPSSLNIDERASYSRLVHRLEELSMSSTKRKVVSISSDTLQASMPPDDILSQVLDDTDGRTCSNQISSLFDVQVLPSVEIPDVFNALMNHNEQVAQDLLIQWIKTEGNIAYAIDTHSTNHALPLFQYPHLASIWSNSATPGLTSTILPMFMKMKDHVVKDAKCTKHEYEVLGQAIERVYNISNTNETLKRVFCFATTGWFSWLVVNDRIMDLKQVNDRYYILNIQTCDILPLWSALTAKALSDPLYYCFPDGIVVADCLWKLGVHPGYCRIKRLCQSGSAVYNVCFPERLAGGVTVVNQQMQQVVIKVHQQGGDGNDSRGTNELRILRKLKDHMPSAYVIATSMPDGDLELFYPSDMWRSYCQSICQRVEELPSLQSRLECLAGVVSPGLSGQCWWELHPFSNHAKVIGKVGIVMFPGTDSGVVNAVDCHICLREIHTLGVVHTDLRIDNIMRFEIPVEFLAAKTVNASSNALVSFDQRRWLVIDYDLAETLEDRDGNVATSVVIDASRSGGRKELIMHCNPLLMDLFAVVWGSTEDMVMLTSTLWQKPATLQRSVKVTLSYDDS